MDRSSSYPGRGRTWPVLETDLRGFVVHFLVTAAVVAEAVYDAAGTLTGRGRTSKVKEPAKRMRD